MARLPALVLVLVFAWLCNALTSLDDVVELVDWIAMSTEREASDRERAAMGLRPLMTRAEFDTLSADAQGYASYWESAWPGSEVPRECPDGVDREAWELGSLRAAIEATDIEE